MSISGFLSKIGIYHSSLSQFAIARIKTHSPRKGRESAIDLKQLEYFVWVAELGSFTRAANILNVVQPALSRQVRLLEEELQQPLLVRTGHGVTPTVAGKRLMEHARGILRQVERTLEDMGRVQGRLASRVAIGLPPSLGKVLTVPLVREFAARLPEASLSIKEGLSSSIHEWLLAGRLDIALIYAPPTSGEIEWELLLEEEFHLVARREGQTDASPITLREAAASPLILPGHPNSMRMMVESECAKLGCQPRIPLEVDSYSIILDLVLEGAGHTIMPHYVVSEMLAPELFHTRLIAPPRLLRKLGLARVGQRATTLTQEVTRDVIKDVASQLFRKSARR